MSLVEGAHRCTCFVSPRWHSFQLAATDLTYTTPLLTSMVATLTWQEGIEPASLLMHLPTAMFRQIPQALFTYVPIFPLSFLPWCGPFFATLPVLSAPSVALSLEISTEPQTETPFFPETKSNYVLQTGPHHYVCSETYTGYAPKRLRFPSIRKTRVRQEAPSVLTIFAMMLHSQSFGDVSIPVHIESKSVRLRGSSPYCVLQALEKSLNLIPAPSHTVYVHRASKELETALQNKYMNVKSVPTGQHVATFLRMLSIATPAVFLDFSILPLVVIHIVN
jgi:hypothetical protein